MSRELIIATKVACDLCGDTDVLIGTSNEQRVNLLLTSFHEWQVGADDVCLGCINAAIDEQNAREDENR